MDTGLPSPLERVRGAAARKFFGFVPSRKGSVSLGKVPSNFATIIFNCHHDLFEHIA